MKENLCHPLSQSDVQLKTIADSHSRFFFLLFDVQLKTALQYRSEDSGLTFPQGYEAQRVLTRETFE